MLEFFVIAIFIVALVIIGCAFWIVRYLLVILPGQQREMLRSYSPAVVNQTALKYGMLPEEQQKQIAEEKIRDIFEESKTPLPSDALIETAIESAIYRQKQEQATLRLEELREEIIRMQIEQHSTFGETPIIEVPNTPRVVHTEGIRKL